MIYLISGHWTKKSLAVLIVCLLMWAWYGFKSIEPSIFPVITSFDINRASAFDGGIKISGTMTKNRDCDFLRLTIYDDSKAPPRLLNVDFLDTPSGAVDREMGYQAWGYWAITPASRDVTITATHECSTGRVKTILYKGKF